MATPDSLKLRGSTPPPTRLTPAQIVGQKIDNKITWKKCADPVKDEKSDKWYGVTQQAVAQEVFKFIDRKGDGNHKINLKEIQATKAFLSSAKDKNQKLVLLNGTTLNRDQIMEWVKFYEKQPQFGYEKGEIDNKNGNTVDNIVKNNIGTIPPLKAIPNLEALFKACMKKNNL